MKCSIRTAEVLPLLVVVCGMWLAGVARGAPEHARVTHLRCEYLVDPLCIDQAHPRLSWRIDSDLRGVKQTAYRILVASSPKLLAEGKGDLWDSGQVDSDVTNQVAYAGRPLQSRERCYWKVFSWIPAAQAEPLESAVAQWSMGLLDEKDWQAEYISYRDETPVFTDRDSLFLPPARQYRKGFATPGKPVRRTTIYATALGIYELYLNGQRVGDAWFAPGWTDYHQRAYYRAYDVTPSIAAGDNVLGAWVADGWYSGYVGFGLLTGIGTEHIGRYTYGKTPSIMAQLEIEYEDGTREVVGTDPTWKVTGDGPIREADLLMGEWYDAQEGAPAVVESRFRRPDVGDRHPGPRQRTPRGHLLRVHEPGASGCGS